MPCSNKISAECVEMLKAAGVAEVCPVCRSKQPPSPQKTFDEGAGIFFPMRRRVGNGTSSGVVNRDSGVEDGPLPWSPSGRRDQSRLDEAVQLWRAAAEQGLLLAMLHLGNIYYDGQGVKKDQAKAREWWERHAAAEVVAAGAEAGAEAAEAAEAEEASAGALALQAEAQRKLGVMYENGQGGAEKSAEAAKRWFEKAAARGDVHAQYHLGCARYHAEKAPLRDHAAARQWFEKAAAAGHAMAQFNLGVMQFQGDGGFAKSPEKAREWYEKAAEGGSAFAQYNLGIMYYEATAGVAQSFKRAFELWEAAAEQGDGRAQYHLGVMYHEGKYVRMNFDRAKYWFDLALEGSPDPSLGLAKVHAKQSE